VWGIFAHQRRWNMMLLEAWRDRLGFPQLIERARKEMRAVYGRRYIVSSYRPLIGEQDRPPYEQEKRADIMIIEEKGSGISLRQMLASEGQDSWPYNPGHADKTSRLHGVSHVAAAGRIWLPESTKSPGNPRGWCNPFLSEVCVYSGPGTTKHDDWVDSFSQGARFFADRWLEGGVGPDQQIRNDSVMVEVDLPPGVVIDSMGEEVEPPYG
jgi:hypothetical protein